MPEFRLRMLGAPVLEGETGTLGPGKPLALLCYLARRREARREELCALLWGEADEAHARNAFRQALHRLRGALGDDVVVSDRDLVRLVPEKRLWNDVSAFEAALGAERFREAVDLYRGDFLEGFDAGDPAYEHWADGERARLRSRYQHALARAVQAALDAGEWEAALEHARRLSQAAPFEADAALLEATALLAAGRRTEALSTLRGFSERHEREVGAQAPVRVREMLERLHAGGPPQDTATRRHGGAASAEGPAASWRRAREEGRADAAKGAPDIAASARRPIAASSIFVGRENEMARLLGIWRRVVGGAGATVLVRGEAGAGKTRLAEEFALRATSLGPGLVLWGREWLAPGAVPYAPVAEVLRAALRAPGLGGASSHLLAEAARLVPELRDRFTLPEPGPVQDDAAKLRFFEGVAAVLDAIAYEQPVCVVLDDLHHSAGSTVELVRYLSGRLRGSPLVFLICYQPEAADGEAAGLGDGVRPWGPAVERIVLEPLPVDDLAEVLEVNPVAATLSPNERVRIAALAAGNPLRALELARRAAAGEQVSALPADLREILWARLEACPPTHRRLFLTAALVGRPLPLRLLAACAHVPEPAALDAVMELQADGHLRELGEGVVPAHETAARLALELAGAPARQLMAGWIAEALAAERAASDAELASLFAQAGRRADAYPRARAAAEQAMATGAVDEAVRLLNLALACAPDEDAQAEVESRLVAVGAGKPRLQRGAPGERPQGGTAQSDPDFSGASRREPSEDSAEVAASGGGREGRVPPGAASGRSMPPGAAVAGTPGAASGRSMPPGAAVVATARSRWSISPRVVMGALAAGALAVLAASAVVFNQSRRAVAGHVLNDTLVLVERTAPGRATTWTFTGRLADAQLHPSDPVHTGPAWLDSLALPWMNPLPSPHGRRIALERMSAAGPDLYVVTPDRTDTLRIAGGPGDDVALGWSPDGQWLLVARSRTLPDGRYDTDLLAYVLANPADPLPLDTSAARSVVDAAWSPDGTHIAWTARAGEARQQDIYLSFADGTGARNLSAHAGEDGELAWSPDGARLAFTSDRDGNLELYAIELASGDVRRLTFDDAQDSRPSFSPDGDFIAFESTRGGEPAVYVVASYGGEPQRVSAPGRRMSHTGWRGAPPPHLELLRIQVPGAVDPGDTIGIVAEAFFSDGSTRAAPLVTWEILDPEIAQIAAPPRRRVAASEEGAGEVAVLGLREGLARVVATTGGWRADTAYVKVGRGPLTVLADDFEAGVDSARWIALGEPAPASPPGSGRAATRGLVPNADRQWESGVLSRAALPLGFGLSIEAWVRAPFTAGATPATLVLALTAPPIPGSVDPRAPQFLRIASLTWHGEAGRFAYAVEREVWTEPVAASVLAGSTPGGGGPFTADSGARAAAAGGADEHRFRIEVEDDGRVAFYIDGKLRWRSTLALTGTSGYPRAHLWLGGQGTGTSALDDLVVRVGR
ncbi:MAG: PD40 domain-containing protein [Gemmatimonadetes bacterium]|nr:PD40 domain-containing protein [Gemmatimonadota bacterium]